MSAAAQSPADKTISEKAELPGIPFAEVKQRAVLWVKMEQAEVSKSAAVTSGPKAECTVSLPLEPGESIAPEYAGRISMKVLIDCWDNYYKYTIFNLKHASKSGKASGGLIASEKPECGVSVMPLPVWQSIQEEASRCIQNVVVNLKEHMQTSSAELLKDQE